ncbi:MULTISPECIES: CBS domain-containing protein [Ferroplasma]|uniref:CBS protein n=1 Tax=Ferroplasma acidarmanus Fer1 TaxID=333146 RepID=S0ALN1_FERAC|nr:MULTISPECIES: CBS domain-containing protein [Ferroplasma]AGO60228.1 CBS protein [Ferroplasma acidarmanus Fer1]WMT53981.1 MAG: CBS domain-containing protein [Ferroplasma acidiphilum]
MTLEISNIMQKHPAYIDGASTIYDGAKKMTEENKGSLLLGSAESMKGIVTERDIIKAIAGGKSLTAPVGDVATKENLIFVHEDDSITKAAVLMSKHNIRHLIVKSENGAVTGVLSTRDLMRESYTLKELANVKNSDWFGSD